MSNWYQPCPHCGANLDPFEVCDCQKDLEPIAQQSVLIEPDTIKPPVITSM